MATSTAQAAFDPQNYNQGWKVALHDAESNNRGGWFEGYVAGWSQGCRESGRSSENCDVQADADPP